MLKLRTIKVLPDVKYYLLRKSCSVSYKLQSPELEGAYNPHKIEKLFRDDFYFRRPAKSNETFSLILPPPNITGTLHLGHALTATIQDILVKWKQMQGVDTLWIPGLDHAGIATQVVVEKNIFAEENFTRHDIGRKKFEEKVWEWKHEKAKIIRDQLRQLGVSLNWEREVFTMDKKRTNAVVETFIRFFEKGLIYRDDALVNWSCSLQSAISDIEVDNLQIDGPTDLIVPGYDKPVRFGSLVHFAYKLENSNEEIIIATTRPETMLGDTAVAVNPNDTRYSKYIGRKVWHPFRKQSIPIISDEFVDPEFGTGVVKVTPGHDRTDFEVGNRHGLEILQIMDEKGNLNKRCGTFAGLGRFQARVTIQEQLAIYNLLRGSKSHKMIVPICSRSRDIVEFLIRPQWFVKSARMAETALNDVREGRLIIEPKRFEKTWFVWLENIKDWCISRQLWWGIRIPAYICNQVDDPRTIWIAAHSKEEAINKAAAQLDISENLIIAKQDEDTLDTWFSSSLQPFSVHDWPEETSNLEKYYPLSLLETGHDILFFWVARMVMLGKEITGKLPFNKILLHGIICDSQGRKMSKSLGNVIAPEDVISGATLQKLEQGSKACHEVGILSEDEFKRAVKEQRKMFPAGIPECGADALRFTLASHNVKNQNISFDIQECFNNKLFCNKIWQASKFTKMWFSKVQHAQGTMKINFQYVSKMDEWILSRLACMLETVDKSLKNYEFHVATAALKKFLYYEFCDIYLETTKRGLRTFDTAMAAGHCWTLTTSLDVSLRALAPFMPNLAQYLHQQLPILDNRKIDFPQNSFTRNHDIERDVEDIIEVVVAIRRLKKTFNVSGKHQPSVQIANFLPVHLEFRDAIQDLSACHKLELIEKEKVSEDDTVKDVLNNKSVIYLKLSEDVKKNIELDLPKLERKKIKLVKELDHMKRMVSGITYKAKVDLDTQQEHSKKIAILLEKLERINYFEIFAKQQENHEFKMT